MGCVSYLNAYPLWRNLSEDLHFAPPAALYTGMQKGDCDLALVPSLAASRHRDWSLVSNTCIASRGPVESVVLFYRERLSACRHILLDSESLTSHALLKILLKRRWNRDLSSLRFSLSNINFLHEENNSNILKYDAFLAIGDKALSCFWPEWERLDLGAAWRDWTGLPFVYALWLARPGVPREAIGEKIDRGLEKSLSEREDWLPQLAGESGLPLPLLRHYFETAISYDRDDEAQEGLERFFAEYRALGEDE